MLSFTYERMFSEHPEFPQLWAVQRTIRELRNGTKDSNGNRRRKIEILRGKATELEIRINNQIFENAKVITSTLAGSASKLLDGRKFSTLFIDEAAQALEPACWIAIRRAGRVIFAGDHCQLPPTVKCMEALKGGLGVSLMEKVAMNHPDAVTLLKTQYRMNENIMKFSSSWFYNNEVIAAPEVKNRGILDFDDPMTWIDTSLNETEENETDYLEQSINENNGKINIKEAELTVDILEDYLKRIGRQRINDENIDVGVISPYKAQTNYLRKLIRKNTFLKPLKRFISVNTVDGFQGQERDIIIISLVRANKDREIGFLKDLRRMNVAITRARMKLIIIGNAETLSRYPFYRKLHETILHNASSPREISSPQTTTEE